MKKTTQRIVEAFPVLKNILNNNDLCPSENELIKRLNDIEKTFLELACFFEEPNKNSFDLSSLYNYLDNDWLEFALELITIYFREDTYLIQNPSYSLIKDGSEYVSLSQFAKELNSKGLNYNRQKLNLYYSRGKIPQPDLIIGGTKYWNKKTVQDYYEQEKRKMFNKDN